MLAGFTTGGRSWRQHHHLGRCTVSLPSTTWLDAVIPRLTEAVQRQDAFPVRSQEMLQCLRMYAHVCASLLASLANQGLDLQRSLPGQAGSRCTAGDADSSVPPVCRAGHHERS